MAPDIYEVDTVVAPTLQAAQYFHPTRISGVVQPGYCDGAVATLLPPTLALAFPPRLTRVVVSLVEYAAI